MSDSTDHVDTLIAAAAKQADGGEAMRFSQAALNAANAMRVKADMPKDTGKP